MNFNGEKHGSEERKKLGLAYMHLIWREVLSLSFLIEIVRFSKGRQKGHSHL